MAVVKWVDGFDKKRCKEFTSVRQYFEKFLILNARALGDTISTKGSKGRSLKTLITYYDLVLNELLIGGNPKTILEVMRKQPQLFPFAENLPDFKEYGTEFSSETKSAVFLIDAIKGAPKCRVCGARYQPDSVNADHKIPKSDGGIGHPKNMGPTHYYCIGGKTALKPLLKAARKRIKERRAPIQKHQHREQPVQ